MAAYIIADVVVTDPDAYAEYRRQVGASLAAYGGTFIVRGGATETLEGDWRPSRIVVLRFESAEQARAWWASSEYEKPKALRQRAAATRMIVVEGYEPPAD